MTNMTSRENEQDMSYELVELLPVKEEKGVRLDRFVSDSLTDLSRTYLQSLIDEGLVLVDGVPRRSAFKVTPGQRISVAIPEVSEVDIQPEDLPLSVIYEDQDVVVLDKEPGMVVHPAPGHPGGTLVNGLLYRYPAISIAGSNRPGIVHRLDKDTSGVMVVALSDRAQTSLVAQWQARAVDKRYVALVVGNIEEDEATIDAPIARDPANRLRMAPVRGGRDALTHFTVEQRFGDATLLNVQIETGRTHQIRVHLAMIGHPVLGDNLYANARARQVLSTLDLGRQFLHASRLTIALPDGETRTFESPLPADLRVVLERLERGRQ
jgi:23S rRNA pseudouridine1911/1915/1917 synthase